MRTGTTVHADAVLTLGIVLAALVLAAGLVVLRRQLEGRWSRPLLPAEDRPPAGLGRLVPVGAQVDEECRRGVVALENWLLARRSRPSGP